MSEAFTTCPTCRQDQVIQDGALFPMSCPHCGETYGFTELSPVVRYGTPQVGCHPGWTETKGIPALEHTIRRFWLWHDEQERRDRAKREQGVMRK